MAVINVNSTHQTSKTPTVTGNGDVIMIQWGEFRITLPLEEARALAAALSVV